MARVHDVLMELRKQHNFYGRYVIRFPHTTMMLNQYEKDANGVFLTSIFVDTEAQGKGEGKKAIRDLQMACSKTFTTIYLSPANYDRSITLTDLRRFYSSLGFFRLGSDLMAWVPGLLPTC